MVVEEGDLKIGRIQDLHASIAPVTSRGRWSGRHTITYTNGGNLPVQLRLSVSDKDEELGFRLEPKQLSVPVGGSTTARLRVRPRNPFLRGAPVHRPFQVVGESAGSVSPTGTSRLAAARVGVPELIPYGGFRVKGSVAGRVYGPAPRASRALRVPAGPAAPALDPRAPAGPGQGRARAGRWPCPLWAPRRLGSGGRGSEG